jgi:ketosteroid isomerase-like protein
MPASCITEAEFARYVDAFNRGDEASYAGFYADDVVLVLAGQRELRGRDAICAFYRTVKAETRRTIAVKGTIIGQRCFAAELESEFLALADLPDFTAGPMAKGDRIYINTFVLYDVTDGKFRRIRSAVFRKEHRCAGDDRRDERQDGGR